MAATWGFAEATLFFLVPDVLLSLVAARGLRSAVIASLFATGGAVAGGAVMYGWGLADQAGAVAALDRVPAVSRGMIDRVEQDLVERGQAAILAGAFTGTPYKIYAVKSAALGNVLWVFLAISIPARLSRFLVVSAAVAGLSVTLGRNWGVRRRRVVLTLAWLVFYALFLSVMPG